jgi:hypothetical protein
MTYAGVWVAWGIWDGGHDRTWDQSMEGTEYIVLNSVHMHGLQGCYLHSTYYWGGICDMTSAEWHGGVAVSEL